MSLGMIVTLSMNRTEVGSPTKYASADSWKQERQKLESEHQLCNLEKLHEQVFGMGVFRINISRFLVSSYLSWATHCLDDICEVS
jgi:hypothetical protein